MYRTINRKNYLFFSIYFIFFVAVILLTTTRTFALEIGDIGAPDSEIPSSGNWLVVASPGSGNGMNSPTQAAVLYLPASAVGIPQQITIYDGCNTGTDRGGGFQTFFGVSGSTIQPGGSANAVIVGNTARCSNSGLVNITIQFTVGPSGAVDTVDGITYHKYVVFAALDNPPGAFYENYFTFATSTPGALLAYAERGDAPPPTDLDIDADPTQTVFYTGIGSRIGSGTWSDSFNFAIPCYHSESQYLGKAVYFYDSDFGAAFQPGPIQYEIRVFSKANDSLIRSIPGQLFGGDGVNNPTVTFNMLKTEYYQIHVYGIGASNTLQIALPGSQMWALDQSNCGTPVATIDSCRFDVGLNSTVFYGWGYDNDAGSEPLVYVDLYASPSGGSTTHNAGELANRPSYRVGEINTTLNNLGSGTNARDNAYGFQVSITGLTTGNTYYVDGNVRDHPSGSWSQVYVNNSEPTAVIAGNSLFSGGSFFGDPRPTIPASCLSASVPVNTAPGGIFGARCDVIPGTTRATISANYFTWDNEGDVVRVALLVDGVQVTESYVDTPLPPANYAGNFQNHQVDRRNATYAITATVNDAVYTNPMSENFGPTVINVSCPLPAVPRVDINSSSCDTLEFTLTDPEGFTYIAELLLAGSPTGDSYSMTPSANNFNAVIPLYKDFSSKIFNVRVTNTTFASSTHTSADVPIGPCAIKSCGPFNPASAQTGVPFDLTFNFGVSNYGNRGSTYNASVNISGLPATFINGNGPMNYVDALGNTTGSTIAIVSNSPSSNTSGANMRRVGMNIPSSGLFAGVATISGLGPNLSCPFTFSVFDYTYARFYGNDVIACGGSIPATTNSVMFNGEYSGLPEGPSTYIGAASQLAIFASQGINGLMSGSQYTGRVNPWDLSFANNVAGFTDTAGQRFGGGVSNCPVSKSVTLTEFNGSTNNLAPALVNGVYSWSGGASDKINGVIANGRRIVIYVPPNASGVPQDITIGDNGGGNGIVYQNDFWVNSVEIPSFTLIVSGNIYIDESVTRIDGHYIAGGEIFTCSSATNPALKDLTGAELEAPFMQKSNFINNECDKQLVVNGSFKANRVHFLRSKGKVSDGVAYETYNSSNNTNPLNIAEVFRFSPEIYLTNGLTTGVNTNNVSKYDSIVSRPPSY